MRRCAAHHRRRGTCRRTCYPFSRPSSVDHQLKDAQAVLFVTPEYNRSIPGALKSAVDVGSRPYGQSIWNGKPGAILSVSMGAIGWCISLSAGSSQWQGARESGTVTKT
jgi:multimeric flavodoxin WrbA